MERTDNMPFWVFFAFMSIETRKGALILIWACAVFALWCVPWSLFFPDQGWVATVFMIDDWSWVGMMIPVTFWYWLCMRWVDKHAVWETGLQDPTQD